MKWDENVDFLVDLVDVQSVESVFDQVGRSGMDAGIPGSIPPVCWAARSMAERRTVWRRWIGIGPAPNYG